MERPRFASGMTASRPRWRARRRVRWRCAGGRAERDTAVGGTRDSLLTLQIDRPEAPMNATPCPWFRRKAGVVWCIGVGALLLGGRPVGAQAPGARLVGIMLSPPGGMLRAHNSLAMKALGSFDDGTSGVDLSSLVRWSSTDPGVAIVQAGYVTGTGSGAVTISATDPATGVSSDRASGGVTVVARLFAIRLQPARRVLPIRESTSYHAFGTFEGGVSLEITSDVDWDIGDPGVASLSATGRARGLTLGSTRVHAVDRRS